MLNIVINIRLTKLNIKTYIYLYRAYLCQFFFDITEEILILPKDKAA